MAKGIRFGELHSYEDLHLILSKVDLPPATVKTVFVDNPGGDGSWDLTEANGKVNYKDRTAKFTFSVLPEDDFEAKKTEISNLLNGRRFKITLDKDPEYYWDGRCSINKYDEKKKLRQITVSATVAPYKLKQEKTRAFVPFCGKNLFDCNDLQTISLGAMTISSIATGVRAAWKNGAFSYAIVKFLPLEMLIGKTITFSCNITESGGAKGTMQIGYSSADGTTRKSAVKLSQSGSASFTVEKTNPEYEYLVIWFYANNGTDPASVSTGAYVDYTNISIELGDTVEDRRNLIPYPYLDTTKTTSGITFTDNGDGSISIKGTATASTYFLLTNGDFGEKSISATNTESATNGEYTLSKRLFYDISNNGMVFININANATVDEVLYPQLEKGTVATEYAPFVPFEPYVAKVPQGKNWWNHGDVTFTTQKGFDLYLPKGTYTISCNITSESPTNYAMVAYKDNEGTTKILGHFRLKQEGRKTFVITAEKPMAQLLLYCSTDYTTSIGLTASYTDVMVENGAIATEYEPYMEDVNITLTNGRKTVSPTIICTGETKVNVNGLELTLSEGTHKVLDFSLAEGETTATLSGSGAAAIVYQEGDL